MGLLVYIPRKCHISPVGSIHEKEGQGKESLGNLTSGTSVSIIGERVQVAEDDFTVLYNEIAAIPGSSHGYQPEDRKEGIGDRDS